MPVPAPLWKIMVMAMAMTVPLTVATFALKTQRNNNQTAFFTIFQLLRCVPQHV